MEKEFHFYDKKYYFKNWDNKRWLMLFHHNFVAKGFLSEEEALSSTNPNKYSILNELNDALKYNDTFEFHLQYQTYIIHWSQNDNPLYLNETLYNQAPGLFVYRNKTGGSKFSGLFRSSIRNGNGILSSLLDGMPKTYFWFYAVGMYNYTDSMYYLNGIPGANGAEQEVTLWVKRVKKHLIGYCNIFSIFICLLSKQASILKVLLMCASSKNKIGP